MVAGAEAKQGMREGVEGSSIDNTLVYPNTPRYAATGTASKNNSAKHFGLSKYPPGSASKYFRTLWSIQIYPPIHYNIKKTLVYSNTTPILLVYHAHHAKYQINHSKLVTSSKDDQYQGGR